MACVKKSKSFSPEELDQLTDLVYKYRNVIENNSKHSKTVAEKKNCWEKLTIEFNSLALNINRTSEQLKKKWDNIKTSRKNEIRDEKRYSRQTGGGPPHSLINNNQIDQFVNNVTDVEISDTPDCDSLPLFDVTSVTEHDILKDNDGNCILISVNNNEPSETPSISSIQPGQCSPSAYIQYNNHSITNSNTKIKRKMEKKANENEFESKRLEVFEDEASMRKKRLIDTMDSDAVLQKLQIKEYELKIKREEYLLSSEYELYTLRTREALLRIELLELKIKKVKFEQF